MRRAYAILALLFLAMIRPDTRINFRDFLAALETVVAKLRFPP